MPVDLTIKRVPDELAERLRRRAARHHRSLQRELLAMLEQHLAAGSEPLTLAQMLDWTEVVGLCTPAESCAMIRKDRNRGNQ
jgi:plasmid stability protein